jgi:transcriptional regulator with XRE-family HTH domain
MKKIMSIGTRLRFLREQKGLSQGDVEKATGLLRCYISRVENGHTVPSLETLERFSAVFEVPLYRLFHPDDGEAATPNLTDRVRLEDLVEQGGEKGEEARFLLQLKNLFAQLADTDREVLLTLAKKLATR